MKSSNATPLIIVFIIVAAILSVESGDGTVFNPLPGGNISSTSTPNNPRNPYPQNTSGGSSNNTSIPPQNETEESAYKRHIRLENRTRSVYSGAPGNESITIALSRSADKPVHITSWQIWSVATGNRRTIGQGSLYPQSNGNSPLVPIILEPGERAVVYSGTSPVKTSFKPNICLSYLNTFNNFPRGVGTRCPDPEDVLLPLPFFDRNDECQDFIERMPSCKIPRDDDFPLGITKECKSHIQNGVGYDNCVDLRARDEDFFLRDWFVYFDSPSKLYKDRDEKILLFDEKGLLVDSY